MTDPKTLTAELVPCPFCGGAPGGPTKRGGSDERSGYNFTLRIACANCGAAVKAESRQDKNGWCNDTGQALAEVVRKWQARATREQTASTEAKHDE